MPLPTAPTFEIVYTTPILVDGTEKPLFLPGGVAPSQRLDLEKWGAVTVMLLIKWNTAMPEVQIRPKIARLQDSADPEMPSTLQEFKSAIDADKGVRLNRPVRTNLEQAIWDVPAGTAVWIPVTYLVPSVKFAQFYIIDPSAGGGSVELEAIKVVLGHGVG